MERSSADSVLRTTQAYCLQICEKQTLDYGIAYYSERFADVPEANQFREVWIEDAAHIPAAFEEAEACFAERGLRCSRWAPAGGRSSPELTKFLVRRGFVADVNTVMVLTRWEEIEPTEHVRVLPARAMRAEYRHTVERTHAVRGRGSITAAVEAYEQRLDDPQLDMFVAMVDGRPAGRGALYAVGDIARAMDLTVLPDFTDRGVERALVAKVLGLARRTAMRSIYVQLPSADTARRSWFEELGFVADGEITEFERVQ